MSDVAVNSWFTAAPSAAGVAGFDPGTGTAVATRFHRRERRCGRRPPPRGRVGELAVKCA